MAFSAEDRLDFAILAHLRAKAPGSEALESAVAALASALPVGDAATEVHAQLAYSTPLLELFEAGVAATKSTTLAEARANLEADPTFKTLLATLTGRGFFNNVEEGSVEYQERFEKVVQQYERRKAAAEAKANGEGAATETAPVAPVEPATLKSAPVDPALMASATAPAASPANPEDAQRQADALKAEGNDMLKAGDYHAAIDKYSSALDLSPDGPQSHIYLSNRAAAYCHLKDYASAVDDCRGAVGLKDTYAKAHARMGFAHFYQENFDKAEECYVRAAELEPQNQNHQDYLRKVRGKLVRAAPAPGGAAMTPGMAPAGGGQPDLSSLMGMMGGAGGGGPPGGIAGLMNNPQMMEMAQQMMSNPDMMRMAQNMMSDPNAMANMMGALGGGTAAPGGGGPGDAGTPGAM